MTHGGRSVAVVGAGMAGLACAQRLHAAGIPVTLFDKGRRPGGRLATRRIGGFAFDHGARYATARGQAFRDFLSAAGEQVALGPPAASDPRWVGVPGMSSLARIAEQRGVGTVLARRQVCFLTRRADGWHLRHQDAADIRPRVVTDAGASAGPFSHVVLALPAPQAAGLMQALGHPLAAGVASIVMQPCWAVMLGFVDRQPGMDRVALDEQVADGHAPDQPFCWIARDSSRPRRAVQPDCWVGHAGPGWSRLHPEQQPEAVLASLSSEFARITGISGRPGQASVHRWRYAQAEIPLGEPCLQDGDGLAILGDWCLGKEVEDAFDSGQAAAAALLAAG